MPMALVRSLGELIVLPPSDVMVSPCARPASWAGPLVTVPATAAPLVDEPPLLPVLPPKNPPKPPLSPELAPAGLTSTPRKAVAPMWMVDDPFPASMLRAIERAALIGMAKPWFPPD